SPTLTPFPYTTLFRSLTGSAVDAEDLAQDVLLRVRTALARYRPGSLEGWLLRITTNLFYDRMRHRARHPTEPLDDLEDPGELARSEEHTSELQSPDHF